MATLPSWITSIDPVAGVSRLLQGFGLGAQVGESQRRGEQADIELANRASMFNQELAQKEASALREYDLQKQLEKAKAETAARNLSGMYEYQQLIAAGVPKDKALMQAAPNLFYKQPDKMVSALQELDQERRVKEYQDQQIAISQGHLDVAKEGAKRKIDEDTLTRNDTTGFATALTKGEDPITAYQKFPRATGPLVSSTLRGQETIEMTPGGGVKIVRGGAGKAGGADVPTTATKTKLQQDLYSHDSAIETLDHLNQNMNESDFGVRGVAKDLWAKVGGQVGVQVDPESLDARNALRLLRASLYRSFRSDANIAEPERKQIEAMFPSEGIIESLPDAISKLNSVKRKLASESMNAAEKLSVKPPRWAIIETLRQSVKSKKMSEDQAVKAFQQWQGSVTNAPAQ